MQKILFIFGTRPEAIKLAPLVKELQLHPSEFLVSVCITAQHREMLDQVMEFFKIKADYDLDLMQPNQSLKDITIRGLQGIDSVLDDFDPDLVIVQGDTTTVFVGALASFYKKIKVAHIEAGLRSGKKYSPFPEEVNRILAGHIADFHLAPTEQAKTNLFNEGIRKNVWVVGNTVIDAILLGLELIKENGESEYLEFFNFLDLSKKIILVTGHRRESFGEPFENICYALKNIVQHNEDIEIVYPVHLNPKVQDPVYKILSDENRIHLIDPLSYPYLIWLMHKSYLVITDSGGIQEEAPSLGKPVLVIRDVTERMEGVEAGTAFLVGTDKDLIISKAQSLLNDPDEYAKMAKAVNPYGDGTTSNKIAKILMEINNK